jgi:lipopolysaccharide/colanic/teichoic acid biosynthesis glycosyltransferase
MSMAHSRHVDAARPTRTPAWKRIEDLVIALPLTVIAAPILLVIATAILVESGWPVFYVDERVGLGSRTFTMIKFRTMVRGAIDQGLGRLVTASDQRITRVGAAMRRWSIDELPQIFNVLRGEMSIVGPRPTYAEQVERYTPRDRGRLRAKPGITGLAQVSGRNDLSWRERIDLDLLYVDRLSPRLDLAILARTPLVVVRGLGLYGKRGVTPDYERD